MRAIRIHEFGGIDTIRLDEIPRPVPGAGEMLVAVKAAGVGPWDRLMREGRISQTLPLTLGSDVSGTVAALGAGVGAFALGDAVYGATNDQFVGGYAEYALVEAGEIAPKPAALDYVTAAGLPVVAVTAWQMLFEYARIEPGQAILVRGAAGSVGACATQMTTGSAPSARPGHRPRAGARRRARRGRRPRWRGIGLPVPRCGHRHDRRRRTRKHLCEALRPNGIIVSVVRAPDEAYLRSKGMRAAYLIVDVTRDRLDKVSAMIERGTLHLPVGEVLDLADASTAHRMLDGAPHKPGKIVLKVAD